MSSDNATSRLMRHVGSDIIAQKLIINAHKSVIDNYKNNFIELIVSDLRDIIYDSKKILDYLQRLQPNAWRDINKYENIEYHDVNIIGNTFGICSDETVERLIGEDMCDYAYNQPQSGIWILEAFDILAKNLENEPINDECIFIRYDKPKSMYVPYIQKRKIKYRDGFMSNDD
jgi:hypothetical protein